MMKRLWIPAAVAMMATALLLTTALAGGEAAQAAFGALATELGVSESGFTLARFEDVTWEDGCLGVAEPGESCVQGTVDGHVVWIAVGSDAYRYHTNLDGSLLRLAAGPFPAADVGAASLPTGATLLEPPDVPPDGPGPAGTGSAGLARNEVSPGVRVPATLIVSALILLVLARRATAPENH